MMIFQIPRFLCLIMDSKHVGSVKTNNKKLDLALRSIRESLSRVKLVTQTIKYNDHTKIITQLLINFCGKISYQRERKTKRIMNGDD